MKHSFDADIAKKYGTEKAVILELLLLMIDCNTGNNKMIHEGKTWICVTQEELAISLPYLSKSKINRHLKEMESIGIITSSNLNKDKRDRAKWYAVSGYISKPAENRE